MITQVGNGLFAKKDVAKGDTICLYTGKLIDSFDGITEVLFYEDVEVAIDEARRDQYVECHDNQYYFADDAPAYIKS